MALIAHEANVEVAGDDTRPVTSLYGDGTDGRHDHLLGERELLTAVLMPEPLEGERAAYFRAISRALAEWPLVEAIVRLVVTEGKIRFARVQSAASPRSRFASRGSRKRCSTAPRAPRPSTKGRRSQPTEQNHSR